MPCPPRPSRVAAAITLLMALAVGAGIAVTSPFGGRAEEAASSDLPVGVSFHGFWNYDTDAEMLTALRTFKDAGGSWVRIDVGWETVEPQPDTYSTATLRRYDAAIEAAHDEGLNVLLVFLHAPTWANGSDDHSLAPRDVSDFGDFAVDIANRYAGSVQAIELWNEPNNEQFFRARELGREAAEHTAMVEDAYRKIEASGPVGDDAVTVLAGGSSHVDVSWWGELYAEGIGDATDVIAVNPYPVPSDLPPTADPDGTKYRLQHLGELIELMREHGDGDKPVWFTEFGWSTHSDHTETPDWARGVSPQQQADFFAETIELLDDQYPEVEQVFWYNLRDREDGSDRHQANFGMLEHDLSPKPVLDRMREVLDRR